MLQNLLPSIYLRSKPQMFVQRIKVFPFVNDVEVRYLHYLITTTIIASSIKPLLKTKCSSSC